MRATVLVTFAAVYLDLYISIYICHSLGKYMLHPVYQGFQLFVKVYVAKSLYLFRSWILYVNQCLGMNVICPHDDVWLQVVMGNGP